MPNAHPILYTIGHSTHPIPQFVRILQSAGVQLVADVRTIPRSRHVPHYNADTLASELYTYDIDYLSFPALGGLRKPRPGSPNAAWRNDSFRGYADYMQTPQFQSALDELIQAAAQKPTAIMCAEAVPWHCHRSLIADALTIRGWRIIDLMNERSASVHKLTTSAHVDGTRLTYPAEPVPH